MTSKIAVQLYSVREFTEKDFAGTVRKIAAMGYAGVEPAGFPGTTAQDAGKLFKELGLAVSSAHTGLPVGKDQGRILEEMAAIGCKNLVCPGVPASLFENKDGIKQAAEQLNHANQICLQNGLNFRVPQPLQGISNCGGSPCFRLSPGADRSNHSIPDRHLLGTRCRD